ncbi:hypothetical protein DXO170_19855, partial [Xanthomonas oryzae pv. oryzae]
IVNRFLQPTLADTDTIADHCDAYPPWCSSTIFTDRSRTSGEHLLALLMARSSQVMEPPGFPGRFITRSAVRRRRRLLAAHS